MRIKRIACYQVDLPLHEGSYNWSGGKSVSVFDSTIVQVETDTGLVGHGEVCPLGPFYLPAYAAGVRAGIKELAAHLLDCDPCHLLCLNQRMDAALKGHPYAKAGIDIACWDILGQACGQPVCTLLGGRQGPDFHLYRAISQQSPDEMAAKVAAYRGEGYRRFQLKVGGEPSVDIARIRNVANLLEQRQRLLPEPGALHLTRREDLLHLQLPEPNLTVYDTDDGPSEAFQEKKHHEPKDKPEES